MNHINRKKKGKTWAIALKLDMSTAYDRVEWDCLQQIMGKLGFHDRWISLVMRCVSFVSYTVPINCQPCGHIVPTRGLRQGDPLSPYLFLICVEGLSTLLHEAVQNRASKVWLPRLRDLPSLNFFSSTIAWYSKEPLLGKVRKSSEYSKCTSSPLVNNSTETRLLSSLATTQTMTQGMQ